VKSVSSPQEISIFLDQVAATNPKVILVGGCSRSGKSSLAESLKQHFADRKVKAKILGLDAWIVSLEKRKPNSTVLERYDTISAIRAIHELLSGKSVVIPNYDVRSRKQAHGDAAMRLQNEILIIEGVVALALEELRLLSSAMIYVEIDDQIRRERFLDFYQNEKGLSFGSAKILLDDREREEVPFVKKTRQFADLVFTSGFDNSSH
jgi:uridine kinase